MIVLFQGLVLASGLRFRVPQVRAVVPDGLVVAVALEELVLAVPQHFGLRPDAVDDAVVSGDDPEAASLEFLLETRG